MRNSCNLPAGRQVCGLMSDGSPYRVLGVDPGLNITGYGVVEMARGGPAIVEAGTIRQRLLKIGVSVRATTRRIVLYFASGYPWKALFETVAARLRRAASAPPPALIDTG